MILIIGNHRRAILYADHNNIPRTEWRLVRREEDLHGYDRENTTVVCISDDYPRAVHNLEIFRKAQALGFSTHLVN